MAKMTVKQDDVPGVPNFGQATEAMGATEATKTRDPSRNPAFTAGLASVPAPLSDEDIQNNPDLEVSKAQVAAHGVRVQGSSGPVTEVYAVFSTEAEYQEHLNVVTAAALANQPKPYATFDTKEELGAKIDEILDEFTSRMFRVFVSPAELQAYAESVAEETIATVVQLALVRIEGLRAEAARQGQMAAGDPVKARYFEYFAQDLETFLTELGE